MSSIYPVLRSWARAKQPAEKQLLRKRGQSTDVGIDRANLDESNTM
jgi:hypothetical protein